MGIFSSTATGLVRKGNQARDVIGRIAPIGSLLQLVGPAVSGGSDHLFLAVLDPGEKRRNWEEEEEGTGREGEGEGERRENAKRGVSFQIQTESLIWVGYHSFGLWVTQFYATGKTKYQKVEIACPWRTD